MVRVGSGGIHLIFYGKCILKRETNRERMAAVNWLRLFCVFTRVVYVGLCVRCKLHSPAPEALCLHWYETKKLLTAVRR